VSTADESRLLGQRAMPDSVVVARNLSTRYLAIATEAALGVLILPFNIAHLGTSAYGLWVLAASVTAYFSVLDMGYSGALVKFVAQYRTRRDVRALNEILSTLFFVFVLAALVMYGAAGVLALFVDRVFHLTPDQTRTAQIVLLIVTLNVAASTAFSVFGGVINGFQRYDLNNIVGSASSVVTAMVNVAVLLAGYDLIALVAAMTAVRVLTLWVYRANAYRVFPGLRISASLFRRSRLREVTGFSIHMAVIDWANKLNYSIDAIIIGAYLSASAVALWTVPQRLAEMLQRLTNQFNGVLFPVVVDSDAGQKLERLRALFVQGTRLSLVSVMPLAGAMVLLMDPLVHAWIGPKFAESVVVAQILICVVAIRVGSATATTVLKGAGQHRLLAFANAGAALANVALSLLWVRRYGLIGQAFGTLLPVAFTSIAILWPAACRRVGIGVGEAFRYAVWPTIWPLAAMAIVLIPLRDALPVRLYAVAIAGAAGALTYATAFLALAVKRDERQLYVAKVTELLRARRRIPAAA